MQHNAQFCCTPKDRRLAGPRPQPGSPFSCQPIAVQPFSPSSFPQCWPPLTWRRSLPLTMALLLRQQLPTVPAAPVQTVAPPNRPAGRRHQMRPLGSTVSKGARVPRNPMAPDYPVRLPTKPLPRDTAMAWRKQPSKVEAVTAVILPFRHAAMPVGALQCFRRHPVTGATVHPLLMPPANPVPGADQHKRS